MKSILVTGGAGFIGGHFIRFLLADSTRRIVNLDKLTYAGSLDSLADILEQPDHRFVQGDIGDRGLVSRLLREHDCDAVVNFAAESHVDRSIRDPLQFARTNVLGAATLLDAALEFWKTLPGPRQARFRFLQISTDEVYGALGREGAFTETSPYAPNSPYSASKAAADHFARAYFQTYGLPTILTHSSNNYGPRQWPEKLIPVIILNALKGAPLPIYGDGRNVRDWLHVHDHCRGLAAVLERAAPGAVYNLGGNCELSNLDVVHTICDTVDRLRPTDRPTRELIQFVPDRPGHDFRYAIDCRKVTTELGWRPEIPFAQGMHETVTWYMGK